VLPPKLPGSGQPRWFCCLGERGQNRTRVPRLGCQPQRCTTEGLGASFANSRSLIEVGVVTTT
jgi:hypothetical protein